MKKNKNKPNFLIVGAPKSGTTSLYQYLQQHKDIFMPQNKEPRFFCNYPTHLFEFGTKQYHPDIITNEDDYLALFEEAKHDSICGEASSDYLACDGAANRIYQWNKDMKIVILLRNPIERAYSEYQHSIAAKFQDLSFYESLRMEKERAIKLYDPIYSHVKRGHYWESVSLYLELFGTDNVKIILFEEFVNSTLRVVESVLTFLNLEPMKLDVTQHFNASTLNKEAMYSLTKQQLQTLQHVFKNDIEQLEKLIGKNLKHWC